MPGKLSKIKKPGEDRSMEEEFSLDPMEQDEYDMGEMEPDDEMEELQESEAPSDLIDKLEAMGYDISSLRDQLASEDGEEKTDGDGEDEDDLGIEEPVPMWARSKKPSPIA